MNIRKQIFAGVTAAALFLSTAAFAQRSDRKFDPEKMLDRQVTMMKEHLKLAPDQETKVRTILQESQTKSRALFEKYGRPERGKRPSEEQMAEMKKIREETKQSLANVLTAEQLTQWEAFQKEHGRRMRGFGKGQRHEQKQEQKQL